MVSLLPRDRLSTLLAFELDSPTLLVVLISVAIGFLMVIVFRWVQLRVIKKWVGGL